MSRRNKNRPSGCPHPRRKLECAVAVGLNAHFGYGHFDSKRTYHERLRKFTRWLRSQDIHRLHLVVPDLVAEYIENLIDNGHKNGAYSLATLKNEMSAINSAMSGYMPGNWVNVQASDLLPPHERVRKTPPSSWDRENAMTAIQHMISIGALIPAAVAWLALTAGLRQREGILCDLKRWWLEAQKFGRVNVQDGTKGGRSADRWITVTQELMNALRFALSVRPTGSKCLISEDKRYIDWLNSDYRLGLKQLQSFGIPGFHDLRAGYACHRFLEISGYPPPCVDSKTPKNEKTRHAQNIIVVELGHGRIEIAGPYVGTFIKGSAT